MKLEVANFDILCPSEKRIQHIVIGEDEFKRRTQSCASGIIVLEQEYLRGQPLGMRDCICFINRIDGVITDNYRKRLKKNLDNLKEWKMKQIEKFGEEIKHIDEEIRKAEELLNER